MGNLNWTVESLKELCFRSWVIFQYEDIASVLIDQTFLALLKRVSYIFSFITIFYKIQATALGPFQWNTDFKEAKFASLVNTSCKTLEVHFLSMAVYFYILQTFPIILLISSVFVVISPFFISYFIYQCFLPCLSIKSTNHLVISCITLFIMS